MVELLGLITANLIMVVIIFIVSIIPLYIAVKMLGGHTSLLKTSLVALLTGSVSLFITIKLSSYAGIVSFLATIVVYRFAFDVGFIRAFLAWLLQGVVLAGFFYLSFLLFL
ncbi:hypothetical protein COV20_02815 [Candidatus Woesearchaeota archaeon CG10_big_fil_rev_8_21_14_0_10_45_16]|nr:MAG: hypothetical protein COV20_02815 [Candidatus Woesearchaeota archaeon CG10_big_fil_rev_8_21_14_0_10_45_16]